MQTSRTALAERYEQNWQKHWAHSESYVRQK